MNATIQTAAQSIAVTVNQGKPPEAMIPPDLIVAIITEAVGLFQRCRANQTPAQALARIQSPSAFDRLRLNRVIRKHAPGREREIRAAIAGHVQAMTPQDAEQMLKPE